jgi:hypothetical protein
MKVGVLLNNTGVNQPAFLAINRINAGLQETSKNEYCVFYKEPSPFCCRLAGTATTLDKMFSFDGAVIATNLDLSLFMLRAFSPKIKVLYLFELEWIKGVGNFLSNASIYNNPEIVVIAPSVSYARELENYCGRKVSAVVPQFNLAEIMKVIENEVRTREQARPN